MPKEVGGLCFHIHSLGSIPWTLSHREGHLHTFTPFPPQSSPNFKWLG